MALLIFITGKQGAGKSRAAKNCARALGAKHVDIDRTLMASGKGIPNPADRHPTDWDLWRNASADLREHRLRVGMRTAYPELEGYKGHLVVEGAILCNAWFLDTLESILFELVPVDATVHRFYLNVSDEVIHRNVHKRADKDPAGRGHEKIQFRAVLDVSQTHAGFDKAVNEIPGRWISYNSSELLEVAIREMCRFDPF